MKALFRKLGIFLHIIVLAGLFYSLQDPFDSTVFHQSRPYIICLDDVSLLGTAQKKLNTFNFPEGATFQFCSPSFSLQTNPFLWSNIPWDQLASKKWPIEVLEKELFKLPLKAEKQDVFLFHQQDLSEIKASSPFAQLLQKKQIRLFSFGPPPKVVKKEVIKGSTKEAPLPDLKLKVKRLDAKIKISLQCSSLKDPVAFYVNETQKKIWPAPKKQTVSKKSEFQLEFELSPGTHVLWAKSGNSFVQTSLHIQPPIQVLSLSKATENDFLATALKAQKVKLVVQETLPDNLLQYQVLLLTGEMAKKLELKDVALIQKFVHNYGGALVFFQGENDYLPEYLSSWLPLKEIRTIPDSKPDVEEEPKKKEEDKPPKQTEKNKQEGELEGKKKIEESTLCLLLVLDRSQSMQGEKIELAKLSAIACLKELKKEDLIGVIAFNQAPSWVLYPTPVWKRAEIQQAIQKIQADGETDIYPALLAAKEVLETQRVSAKHIILLSDGYSRTGNYGPLIDEMTKRHNITISTIGIGVDFDHALLANLSARGKGRFYFTSTFDRIAHYLILDTKKVIEEFRGKSGKPKLPKEIKKKPKIAEKKSNELPKKKTSPSKKRKEFQVVGLGPLFHNISPPPPVLRYREATLSAKAKIYASVEKQPLMAITRDGMGKILHFLGHFDEDWAPKWLYWESFAPFWSQALKHIALEKRSKLSLQWEHQSTAKNTVLKIRFPAFLETDRRYFLEIAGATESIKTTFEAPNVLRAEFPFPGIGFYSFKLTKWKDKKFEGESFFKGLLAINHRVKKLTSQKAFDTNQKVSSQFASNWTLLKQQPIKESKITRYFSRIIAVFVFLIFVELLIRRFANSE